MTSPSSSDGQVIVTGRRKDVIFLNGHNHYSHEIEEVAAGVPGVRTGSVAACGVPDRNTGSESLALFFVSTGARLGWQAQCDCGEQPVPCTVLDPFSGSGTTGEVAIRNRRRYLGIELNPQYVELSWKRLAKVQPLLLAFNEQTVEVEQE